MTNLELDEIELILTIASQTVSKQMKWVMWYNKKNLQHHNSLERITLIWWQWGILKLFAQNQKKGNLLFDVWLMRMKRAMPPFEQGIQNCSKMILTSLRQVRNWWCACPLTSLMNWMIKMDSYWQELVGQVDEASEESSIKQHQTDQIYKAHWKTSYIYENSREYDIQDDCHIYEIFIENNITHYMNFGQINDVIGDEEWLQGEGNCLCNIASSRIISLSWGAKKKEFTHSDALCICEGDRVSVENNGKHWVHLGNIISIDKNAKTAVVKWEETLKKGTVHLDDCKK